MRVIVRMVIVAAVGFLVWRIGVAVRGSGIASFGSPPISRPAFYLAKLSMAFSISMLLWNAAVDPPRLTAVACLLVLALVVAGSVFCAAGISRLGRNLRVGLPEEKTALVTSGIYGYSRNPIYAGIYAVLAASLIYAFSWLNLFAVLLTVTLHHFIILVEERFLARRFAGYESYRSRVRRYL